MSKKRVFVFGLDGASWKIIDSLIDKGYLPFFEKLSNNGIRRDLYSTIPPRTAPAWASFMTGKTPAEHGVFDFVNYTNPFKNSEEPALVNNKSLCQPEFWRQWDKNKKIALINLPLTYPIRKLNGVMVSSIMTPPNKTWFYPDSLMKKLNKYNYQLNDYNFLLKMKNKEISHREMSRQLRKMAENKFKLAQDLVGNQKWDFFFMLFNETDWCQHWFWRSSATRRLYQQLDRHLERLYEILKEKYGARHFHFILISDHGFHPFPKKIFHPYPWLRKKGFIKGGLKAFLARGLRKASFWQKNKTKSKFNSWADSDIIKAGEFGLWLNKTKLGDEYDLMRDRIIKELKQVKFENGWRVFKMVKPREKVYQGKKLERAPDIVWLTRYYFSIETCPIEGKMFVDRDQVFKANHISDRKGIFLAKGWGLKGKLRAWENKKLHIWDLAQIFNQTIG